MTSQPESTAARLNCLLAASGLELLDGPAAARFESYLALLVRWNARMNLTAIRDEEGILGRHFVESIACARALPEGIVTLLDFGSGAGIPGIPIALCRPEIHVTLAESQGKKAAFLQEAVRVLGLRSSVHPGRAERLSTRFDCVVLRAVDRMHDAVSAGASLVSEGGWMAVVTTGDDSRDLKASVGEEFLWKGDVKLPGTHSGLLALAQRGSRVGFPQ